MKSCVDANTEALKAREQINAAGARYDLEDWIISNTKPRPGAHILDLGCGRGKQSFALAPIISPAGLVLGVDISRQAVDEVNQRAGNEGIGNVRAVKAALDECLNLLQGRSFDYVLSTYAIYYSKDMQRLLSDLRSLLKPRGQLFVCGPGRDSNQEIIEIINAGVTDVASKVSPISDFIEDSQIREVAASYSDVRTVRLANTIRFPTAESVLRWWTNHNSFMPDRHDDVASAIQSHFAARGEFVLTKNVLGVHYFA